MARIMMPSLGPDSWRQLLSQPELQWRTGFSAKAMAHAWEAANGLPPEVASVLSAAFGPVELLLAIPEHKTPLVGQGGDSQSDVLALVRSQTSLIACTVEGKVEETFGKTVGDWLVGATDNKAARLAYLCRVLGLERCPPDVHYQLLHRAASALIEADRFHASDAAMVVHSFSPTQRWFNAFARFAALFGATSTIGQPCVVTAGGGRRLVLGWACGDERFRQL
jgi:hypothetical protein